MTEREKEVLLVDENDRPKMLIVLAEAEWEKLAPGSRISLPKVVGSTPTRGGAEGKVEPGGPLSESPPGPSEATAS